MQYRNFGKKGIKLSVLGFGAMRLPGDHDEAIGVMRRAFELGVNYVDTAFAYPDSEIKCGKAFKGWRDKIYISTKNPLMDNTVEGWWGRLNQSLERLDTEYIDFYQVVHGMDWNAYETFLLNGGGMKAVRKAHEQGLIKHICFSCHETPENMMKLINTGEFAGMTLQYNLLNRTNEEVIAYAHEKGMGVIVMGPVGGGMLAAPSEQIRNMIPAQVKSSTEIALRFVFANPNVTCAISGMSTLEMVEENCAVASREEPLSPRETQAIADALEETKRLAELYCTGCNYCLPCPNGVNIPENFKIMNLHKVYGLTDHAREMYEKLGDNKADQCIECGQCEPKCPQNIKIMAQLKEVTDTMKG